MTGVIIYAYFATTDVNGFTFHNKKTDQLKTWDIKKGDALYIGIDSNGERHDNHLKPSKKHEQAINTFIQEYDYHYEEIGSSANKDLAHPMEIKLIQDFSPLLNTYGSTYAPSTNKLTLKDVNPDAFNQQESQQTKETQTTRFNNLDALAQVVDEQKLIMFKHKARNVIVIGAKDSGKSFPLDAYKIMCMERDPMASIVTLMKYSTKSGAKGIRSLSNMVGYLTRNSFTFPQNYEPSTGFFYRLPRGKKSSKDLSIKMKSQFIQFGSFEDSDDLAGFTVSNGGYPALIHIEEPVMQGDTAKTPTAKQWDADVKTIHDTIYRHWRDYNNRLKDKDGNYLPHTHAPIKYKIITTMNDWDPEHVISKRAEKYFPQNKFLDWILGFKYSELLKLWRDKIIDADTVVPELKAEIDARWDDIKESIKKNHTQWIYVERDDQGKFVDTLYGRMQKFSNPALQHDEEEVQSTLEDMYNTLITGDTLGLAKAFGMGFGGTADDDKRFNFKSFKPIDTDKKLKERGRKLLGFCVAWDHDANRGPVATPVTLSAIPKNVGNPFDPEWEYTEPKILIHPQVEIDGYGKGKAGEKTRLYHELMIKTSKELITKYVGVGSTRLEYGKWAIFDDDDGSYIGHIAEYFTEMGFDDADALPNKNGKIEDGGFGVIARDNIWEVGIDLEEILIDSKNQLLVDFFKQVPATITPAGEKKRSTQGKWGARYKDVSNSAEYAWYPFRMLLWSGMKHL